MAKIDFVISNNRHHVEMFAPVLARLRAGDEVHCRVLSLCEFRGLPSPCDRFRSLGVEFRRLIPFNPRPPLLRPLTQSVKRTSDGPLPARALAWWTLLAPPLHFLWRNAPDLVVLPNDAAYPYDRISETLKKRMTPFLLVQEGIRFLLPASSERPAYGQGGATAVAAWGQSSADYFCDQGVDPGRIRLTGNPRFDDIPRVDWAQEARKIQALRDLGDRVLLLVSNPIDEQGFCTSLEKLETIVRFASELEPLFRDPDLRLVVKLHASESGDDFRRALATLPTSDRITVLEDVPLYPLLAKAEACVVLASTVGLEALLIGLPLGVLEIPGFGFAFDYISEGVAHGLSWRLPMPDQVLRLLESQPSPLVDGYLGLHLRTHDRAADLLAELVRELASGAHAIH
jgi:hypothetical protein